MNLNEMDSQTRKQLLAVKLRANWQRRARERYLAELPADLSSYLFPRPCLYTPELDAFAEQWYPVTDRGIGQVRVIPKGYHYEEVLWEQQALAAVERVGSAHDTSEAVFFPYLTPDACPGFLVEFGWARLRCSILLSYGINGIAIVRSDLLAGLVIDSHAATPDEHNPNPAEVTYEIGWWDTDALD
jgi:hypothetical protein